VRSVRRDREVELPQSVRDRHAGGSPTSRNLRATGKRCASASRLTDPYLYLYFRIRPQRPRAWREANELKGRELMRGGEWTVPD
jgi:hypothetical protein